MRKFIIEEKDVNNVLSLIGEGRYNVETKVVFSIVQTLKGLKELKGEKPKAKKTK